MFIFYLFILQAISASYSYDLELEGVMKLGKDFLRTLNQHASFAHKLKLPPLKFASKGKLPKKTVGSAAMRAFIQELNINNNTDTHTKPSNNTEQLKEFVTHLQRKGRRNLRHIAKQIKKDMNIHKDTTLMLNTVTEDYVTMMQNYYNFVTEDDTDTLIDKEFVYLDLIETSSRMLYSEERKLLNDIILGQNTNYSNASIQSMNEKIYKNSVNNKKDEMQYLCNAYNVCRQYPAFTDYCADLMSEILKLSDNKFQKLNGLLADVLINNEEFFKTVSEKEDRELMTSVLQTMINDIFSMREFYGVLRAVITQRFKTVPSNHEKLKMRTKAMRILLDIIDKALSLEEDLISIDFDNTLSAIRSWSKGVRKNIDDIFAEFAKHLLRMFEYNLTKNARKEMSVLIELIMRGSTEKKEIYERLFKNGSKFVKGEDFHPDIDIVRL